MMPSPIVDEALDISRQILRRNLSAKGLSASPDVYQQVWVRDSVITLLGATMARDPKMLAVLRVSLDYVAARQDRFGQIPFFVRIADDHAEYGSVDSNPWFVIGAAIYLERSGDEEWWAAKEATIIRALDWCESRDFNKSSLMDSVECDDWADLLCNRGKVLFPNVLYAHALRMAARLLGPDRAKDVSRFRERDLAVRAAIQNKLWVAPPGSFTDDTHHQARMHMSVSLRARAYFLPWVSLFEYGDRFDSAGNLLAILCDVASEAQAESILNFIQQAGLDQPFPVRVLHPPIQPGERDWRDYYKVWGSNLPDQYHNGGIWPWVGGLYIAALVKMGWREKADRQVESLARALEAGGERWECREWIHARSGQPMGAKAQAWSAGMMIYAEHVVRTGEVEGFENFQRTVR